MYKLQIWKYNVGHTNIITIKDVIILEKTKEKKLSEGPADTTVLGEVGQASSLVDFTWKYRQAISNVDMDAAKKLELTKMKKYWRHAGQVPMELGWLHD